MFRTRNAFLATLLACVALLGGLAVSQAAEPVIRPSKFFDVDVTNTKIAGPAKHVPGTLHLNLASITVDQPQYWPNEAVHLKVMMPGRPNAKFKGTVQRKDANKTDVAGALDAQGVAVLTVLDGAKDKLAVGEYRIDVKSEDNKAGGHATFSVVEGTLGAVSLAYDFKQVTTIEELEKANGAWFMGNPGGAGKRWGNGLSFKNEIRLANQPFDGDVQCISRCMLPGCNGVQAGSPKTYKAVKGKIEGTMDVGGHSGPFQIEFVTPKGSLRHQFEGSSHVERDFVQASGGVTWMHRAGLAPYEKTVPVPGRQIFVEKSKGSEDPFEIDSIVARKGELSVHVAKDVAAATLVVWTPKGDGDFEPKAAQLQGDLKAGTDLTAKIAQPYSLVTIAGYVGGQFKEGWALAFVPAGLQLDVDVPAAAAPAKAIQVGVSAKDETGAGTAVSGILEVYDNRVADRSPFSGLASELGDSIRNTSNSVSSWQDRTGIDEQAERRKLEEARREMEADKKMNKEDAAPSRPSVAPMAKSLAAPGAKAAGGPRGRAMGGKGGATSLGAPEDEEDDEKQEFIREGEKKVVFCDVVRTDASGKASVEVTLPPQIGRVSVRFVAVKGLDHATVQKGLDVAKKASVEVSMPKTFIPGAQLQVPLAVTNTLQEAVTLTASGAGLKTKFTQAVAPGTKDLALAWAPTEGGKVQLELLRRQGQGGRQAGGPGPEPRGAEGHVLQAGGRRQGACHGRHRRDRHRLRRPRRADEGHRHEHGYDDGELVRPRRGAQRSGRGPRRCPRRHLAQNPRRREPLAEREDLSRQVGARPGGGLLRRPERPGAPLPWPPRPPALERLDLQEPPRRRAGAQGRPCPQGLDGPDRRALRGDDREDRCGARPAAVQLRGAGLQRAGRSGDPGGARREDRLPRAHRRRRHQVGRGQAAAGDGPRAGEPGALLRQGLRHLPLPARLPARRLPAVPDRGRDGALAQGRPRFVRPALREDRPRDDPRPGAGDGSGPGHARRRLLVADGDGPLPGAAARHGSAAAGDRSADGEGQGRPLW
ncbi:MAG: alpha-2-macroglobulin family protein [Myxococcales bacterium]